MIFIASDHAGFELKAQIIQAFKDKKLKIQDMGPKIVKQTDDYSDYAFLLAKKVAKNKGNFGILVCRNGIGMSIAANKVKGIRAGLCTSIGQAVTARAHDNCNIVVLGSDFASPEQNIEIVNTFLSGHFSGEERHIRRLGKISKFEKEQK